MNSKLTLFLLSAVFMKICWSRPNIIGSGLGYGNSFGFGGNNFGLGGNSFGYGGNSFSFGGNNLGFGGNYGCGIPTSGGGLPITSSSPISPTGLAVASENVIDGALAVTGSLPFLGAVALDGKVPAEGQGSVAYSCGSGNIGITSATGGTRGFGFHRGFGFDF